MKNLLIFLFLLGFTGTLKADPPEPPTGKRWVVNPHFSDEFNGTDLDTSKWLDHHPTWIGREPGLFMPSQVSVKNGCLQIRGEKMEKDTVISAYGRDRIFNIKGGAVVSKKPVYLGYFECRVKAAATTMSTTFWFSGGGGKGPKGCDSYSQEWDIQECVGREGDFDGKYFASGMHSNAHFWYRDCEGKRSDFRAKQVIFEEEELASENFHVYGGWWRNERSASYYYDNGEPKHQKFYDEISKAPMDKPMYMRLVCETYPFPWIELPNDEELADTTKNTVYYDWVRSYSLVDAAEPAPEELRGKRQNAIFKEIITFPDVCSEQNTSGIIELPYSYKANEDRKIKMVLLDPSGTEISETSFVAYAGYARMILHFDTDLIIEPESGYTLEARLLPLTDEKAKPLYTNTTIIDFI